MLPPKSSTTSPLEEGNGVRSIFEAVLRMMLTSVAVISDSWPGNLYGGSCSNPEFAWTSGPDDTASMSLNWEGGHSAYFFCETIHRQGFLAQGVSISIWGVTATLSQNFQVSIDSYPAYTSSTTDSDPQTYMQWYESAAQSDGQHTLDLTGNRAMTVDFFLVKPSLRTLLSGKTLFVDDDYTGITYSGSGWKLMEDQKFLQASFPGHEATDPPYSAQPIGNGTHQTSVSGDSFSFKFVGKRPLHNHYFCSLTYSMF
jgi:hypothetical protein